jgi:hypothetical protein
VSLSGALSFGACDPKGKFGEPNVNPELKAGFSLSFVCDVFVALPPGAGDPQEKLEGGTSENVGCRVCFEKPGLGV